ncbi:MAG: serine hydrolase [Aliishimia sp.]
MFSRFLTVTILCLAGASALADPADRVLTAFQGWLAKADANGALALVRKGRVVASRSLGLDATQPVELASLSKAITGVCAAQLVKDGVLTWDDTLSAKVGRGPDITLAQLITQSGGIGRDSTQRLMRTLLDTSGPHQSVAVLDKVAKRKRLKGDVGKHIYTNENYALAALMIEAATGRNYADVCAEKAFIPADVTAKPSPRAGTFLPWGGWQMSVADHAIWHNHWFGAQYQPKSQPSVPVDRGVSYGTGAYFRMLSRGNTAWHFGAFCFPGKMNVGSYVVTLFGEWTIMAAYDACVSFEDMFALDTSLVDALFRDTK